MGRDESKIVWLVLQMLGSIWNNSKRVDLLVGEIRKFVVLGARDLLL